MSATQVTKGDRVSALIKGPIFVDQDFILIRSPIQGDNREKRLQWYEKGTLEQ
ncbi:hypothetical protein CHUAL_008762 [Chamberlinius hualienensis]